MTESLQNVIKRLKKFNNNYLNNKLNRLKFIRYEHLYDFCYIYLLKDDKVLTINRDGTQTEDYKNFDEFNEFFTRNNFDTFLVDYTENGNIEYGYKTYPKNNTVRYINFNPYEISMKYVMCYVVTFDIFDSSEPIVEYLGITCIPIINYDDQSKLARKFKKLYEVIKFLEKQAEPNNS